jgi:hypothetical protein
VPREIRASARRRAGAYISDSSAPHRAAGNANTASSHPLDARPALSGRGRGGERVLERPLPGTARKLISSSDGSNQRVTTAGNGFKDYLSFQSERIVPRGLPQPSEKHISRESTLSKLTDVLDLTVSHTSKQPLRRILFLTRSYMHDAVVAKKAFAAVPGERPRRHGRIVRRQHRGYRP